MSVSINGTGGITFADASTQSTGGYTGFRNRIINGAMMIDQRNAGASVTPTTATQFYTLDRFAAQQSASAFSVQQNAGSVTPPSGFTNYLGVTVTSAQSLSAGSYFAINHYIEGYNTADLGFGTASAQPVTISFWVRSSLTGSFSLTINNGVANRAYPVLYTINSANTWEYKTIKIPGDTTGTWLTNSYSGIRIWFGLGFGSNFTATAGIWSGTSNVLAATGATSIVGTNGATFYITGVQLEKGSVATPFEFRPYGTELALCQRYYNRYTGNNAIVTSQSAAANTFYFGFTFPPMRTTPTVSSSANWTGSYAAVTNSTGNSIAIVTGSNSSAYLSASGGSGGGSGVGQACPIVGSLTTSYFDLSAEI